MLLVLTLAVVLGSPVAQETAPPDPREDRYLQALMRSPRPGTAFDRWYQSALEHGRLESVLEERAAAAQDDTASLSEVVVLGLLFDRMGRTDEALRAWDRAESISPQDPLPARLKGDLHRRRRDFRSALQSFEQSLAKKPPVTERGELLLEIGRLRLQLGLTGEAFQTFKQLVDEHPEDRSLREELAELLAEQGETDEALSHWNHLMQRHADDGALRYRATLAIARLEHDRGNRDAAFSAYDALLDQLDSDSWQAREVHQRMAEAFRDDAAGYRTLLEEQVADRPDAVGPRLRLAEHLVAEGEDARQALDVAQRLAPGSDAVASLRVRFHADRGEFDQALRTVDVWAAARPDSTAPRLRRVELLRDRLVEPSAWPHSSMEDPAVVDALLDAVDQVGLLDETDPALGRLAADTARELHARFQWMPPQGDLLDRLAEWVDRWYEEAGRRDPTQAVTWEARGRWQLELGEPEAAAAHWWAMVDEPRDVPSHWARLVELLSRQDRRDDAYRAAESWLERAPRDANAHERVLQLLAGRANRDDARPAFERVSAAYAALAPERLAVLIDRRIAFELASGSADDALERLPALERNVERAWTRGRLFATSGRQAEAIEPLTRAHQLAPEHDALIRDLASAYETSGQVDEAIALLREAAERAPHDAPRILDRVIAILRAAQRSVEAREVARELVEARPDLLAPHRLLADLEFETRRPEQGIDVLRDAVRLEPRDIETRLALAERLWQGEAKLDAFEHEWRCFEMSRGLDEQRALALRLADHAIRLGRGDDLLARVQRFAGDRPTLELQLCTYDVLRRTGLTEKAREMLRRLQDLHPTNPDILMERKRSALDAGEVDVALGALERYVSVRPEPAALEELAILYAMRERSDDAARAWRRLLRTTGHLDPLLGAVQASLDAEAWDEALTLARIGLEADPSSRTLHLVALWLLVHAEDVDAAHAQVDALLRHIHAGPLQISRLAPDPAVWPVCEAPGTDDTLRLDWSSESRPAPDPAFMPMRWPADEVLHALQFLGLLHTRWNDFEPSDRARAVLSAKRISDTEARLTARFIASTLQSDPESWLEQQSALAHSDHERTELGVVAWALGKTEQARALLAGTHAAHVMALTSPDRTDTDAVDRALASMPDDSIAHWTERVGTTLVRSEETTRVVDLLTRHGLRTTSLSGLIRLAPLVAECANASLIQAWHARRLELAPTGQLTAQGALDLLWAESLFPAELAPPFEPTLGRRALEGGRPIRATPPKSHWILVRDSEWRRADHDALPPTSQLTAPFLDLAKRWLARASDDQRQALLDSVESDAPTDAHSNEPWHIALLWWNGRTDDALSRLASLAETAPDELATARLSDLALAQRAAGEFGAALRTLDRATERGARLPAMIEIEVRRAPLVGDAEASLQGLLYMLSSGDAPSLERLLPHRDYVETARRLARGGPAADLVQRRREDGFRAMNTELPGAHATSLVDTLEHARQTGRLLEVRHAVQAQRRAHPDVAGLLALDALTAWSEARLEPSDDVRTAGDAARLAEEWVAAASEAERGTQRVTSQWIVTEALRFEESRRVGERLRNELYVRTFHENQPDTRAMVYSVSLRSGMRLRGTQAAKGEVTALLTAHDEYLAHSPLRHDDERRAEATQTLIVSTCQASPPRLLGAVAHTWLEAFAETRRMRRADDLAHDALPRALAAAWEYLPAESLAAVASSLEALLFRNGLEALPQWNGVDPEPGDAPTPLVEAVCTVHLLMDGGMTLSQRWSSHPRVDHRSMQWLLRELARRQADNR